jgi:histone acetyltransferase MYST1
LFTSF